MKEYDNLDITEEQAREVIQRGVNFSLNEDDLATAVASFMEVIEKERDKRRARSAP